MKIWILTSETPHYWAGGIARYVDNFARAAGALGNEITVISRGDSDRETEIAPGYRLIEFTHRFEAAREHVPECEPDAHPGWPYNNMAYFAALSHQYVGVIEQLIQERGAPDIIESQDYAALPYFLLQNKLTRPDFLTNVPVLIHLHTPDFAVQAVNQYPRYKLPDYWIGRMERACIWMADAVLSPSRFIAGEISKWLEGEAPEVTTIPYPWPGLAEAEPVNPGSEGVLVYPGRIELRKGVEPLLVACEELWREGRDFRMELVGGDVHTPLKGGSLIQFLKNRYAHRVESGQLVFCGSVQHTECLDRMRTATAVVIPSLWENFPNTCIEAMSLGKVVVASETGGQAEMVGRTDSAGILFRHAEADSLKHALSRALGLPENVRLKMGEQARERISDLCHPEKVLPRRLEHYQKVIATYRPKARYPFSNKRLRDGSAGAGLAKDPLVTVVIPYYNLGAYLEECVDSILSSEGVRFEILIINDGSTDEESLTALNDIRSRGLPNLRILDIPNGGLANARNVGADNAKGELVAFVDADDKIGPEFLARASGLLQRYPNVHLVYSWVRFFDEGRGIWHSWTFDLPYLLCHNQLVPIALVRKETFLKHGRNKPHIVYGLEDYESWISLAEAGCGGVAIPEPLVQYRIRSNSMFKVIEADKKLYLYDLISHEHPDLSREYGLELFNLENANGPAYGWDQPTMFRSPQERLMAQADRDGGRMKAMEAELQRLREAEQWHQKELARLLSQSKPD
jgi:glycosyltransferase involved in cell wall biosynthesis